MAAFMSYDVIKDWRRCENQPPRKRQRSSAFTVSFCRALFFNQSITRLLMCVGSPPTISWLFCERWIRVRAPPSLQIHTVSPYRGKLISGANGFAQIDPSISFKIHALLAFAKAKASETARFVGDVIMSNRENGSIFKINRLARRLIVIFDFTSLPARFKSIKHVLFSQF